MMGNQELNIEIFKVKSKKKMFIKLGIVLALLIIVLCLTLYNDLLYQVIGRAKFIVVYILGLALSIAYLVLNYTLVIPNEDLVFLQLVGTKKEEDFYEIFPEEENYKLGKKAKVIRLFSNLLEYYLIIMIAIFCVVFMFTFILFPAEVEQHSMETTLFEGNKVLVFNSKKAENGDIVVFRYDSEVQKQNSLLDGDLLIKRVIAQAGDTFECKDGYIYVNGILLDEHYVNINNFDKTSYTLEEIVSRNQNYEELMSVIKDGKIPEGYYLLLGDNRNNSNDSEEFGLVHYKQLIGVVKYYRNDFGWHKN